MMTSASSSRRFPAIAAAASALLAAALPAGGQESAPKGAARPERPVKTPDLCAGAVDPYDGPAERSRFFRAAGVDNELDAKEFQANRAATEPFARRFDRWSALIRFDRDANGTIDWFEAKAYREALRERILTTYDTDRNGRLTGPEREVVNRALATGSVPGMPRRGGRYRPVIDWKAYDRDGDGRLSREEMRAYREGARERAQKRHAEWMKEVLGKYDSDGDGKLSGGEREKMLRDSTRERFARLYDSDRDGKLSEAEAERVEAAVARADAGRRRWAERIRKYDTNGNGRLDAEEWKAWSADRTRKYDADGDGRLDEEESRTLRWDTDRDGKLSEVEAGRANAVAAAATAAQKRWAARIRKYDTNGNGRIDGDEWKAYRDDQQSQVLKRYDTDGDGKISAEEREAIYAFGRRLGEAWRTVYAEAGARPGADPRKWRAARQKVMDKYDTNRDGRLDPVEQERFVKETLGD